MKLLGWQKNATGEPGHKALERDAWRLIPDAIVLCPRIAGFPISAAIVSNVRPRRLGRALKIALKRVALFRSKLRILQYVQILHKLV